MGKADISGKWLLGEDPDVWVRWMLADLTLEIEAFLSAEFQHVLRHSDVLLRLQDDDGPFLLLIELQLHYDPDMPWRMQAYAALAEEKYRLPAYPLVFYLLPPPSGVELLERYYREFRSLVARRDFRVVKAWELDAQEVLRAGPLTLVPLTPLMRGADEEVLRAGAQVLRERGGRRGDGIGVGAVRQLRDGSGTDTRDREVGDDSLARVTVVSGDCAGGVPGGTPEGAPRGTGQGGVICTARPLRASG